MPWLLFGVLVLVLLLVVLRAFVKANPKTLARSLRQAAAILLGAGAAYFLFTGRFGPAMLLGTGSLMALGRWPGGIPGFGDFGAAPATGNSSEVETQWLRMELDHDTGEIDGQVLQGAFKGSRLQELSFEQLLELLADCRVSDNQSAALLETYLDRAHGEDWRERSAGGGRNGPAPTGKMNAAEAREILGVGPGASPDEIRDAHRRLMKKVHPDQGGSTYLASKINEAKDLLLGL